MYLNSLAFKQGSTKHTYCGWVGEAVKLYRGGLRDPGAPESYEVVYNLNGQSLPQKGGTFYRFRYFKG